MGQVGFRVDDAFEAQLQQALAVTGVDRATFSREAVRVAMVRAVEGFEPFARDSAPRLDPKDAAAVLSRLDRYLMDFERIAADFEKQGADLHKLKRADADAMHRARREFLEGFPDRIQNNLGPVRQDIAALSAKLDEQPGVTALASRLERMEGEAKARHAAAAAEAKETHDLVKKAMREPRTINTIDLSKWTVSHLAILLPIVCLLSLAVFFVAARIFPDSWLALPMANSLLGEGDRAICQLVEYRTSMENCHLRINSDGRGVGVRGSAVTNEPEQAKP